MVSGLRLARRSEIVSRAPENMRSTATAEPCVHRMRMRFVATTKLTLAFIAATTHPLKTRGSKTILRAAGPVGRQSGD